MCARACELDLSQLSYEIAIYTHSRNTLWFSAPEHRHLLIPQLLGGIDAKRFQLSPSWGPALSWREQPHSRSPWLPQCCHIHCLINEGLVPWSLLRQLWSVPCGTGLAFIRQQVRGHLAQSKPIFFSPLQILILRTLPSKVFTSKYGATTPFYGQENKFWNVK